MGDKDAAVQVLREVIRDGDVGQQERARRILADLNP
jgi:FimV-like protein